MASPTRRSCSRSSGCGNGFSLVNLISLHKRTTELIPQLSQTLVKHPADILEYHSISLSVLMTQRIAGWSLLDSKVNVNTSYFLQSLADIQLGLAPVIWQNNWTIRCVQVPSVWQSLSVCSFFAAESTKVRQIKFATWEKRCTVHMEDVYRATPAYV